MGIERLGALQARSRVFLAPGHEIDLGRKHQGACVGLAGQGLASEVLTVAGQGLPSLVLQLRRRALQRLALQLQPLPRRGHLGRTPQSYFRGVDGGTANYRELYWRVYVRNQAGWVGGGADKLTRAISFASSSTWAEAMIAHVWSGYGAPRSNYMLVDPASGTDASGNLVTTTYNDFANLRWLGAAQSATPLFDASHVGPWYCVEAHARLNDPGSANGVFELWINGTPEAQTSGLNWVGGYTAYGINALYLENFWNDGAPQAEERYLDNLSPVLQSRYRLL